MATLKTLADRAHASIVSIYVPLIHISSGELSGSFFASKNHQKVWMGQD